MFQAVLSDEAAALRASYETLAEIVQHKGSSECYYNPLGQTDELCAFEQLPQRSWSDNQPPQPGDGFLREVLKEGLALEQSLGTNPFRFGFIGSTDTHLGAGWRDQRIRFPRPWAAQVSPPEKKYHRACRTCWNIALAAWLFCGQKRTPENLCLKQCSGREAYATSGPRILTRFFGGSELPQDIVSVEKFCSDRL